MADLPFKSSQIRLLCDFIQLASHGTSTTGPPAPHEFRGLLYVVLLVDSCGAALVEISFLIRHVNLGDIPFLFVTRSVTHLGWRIMSCIGPAADTRARKSHGCYGKHECVRMYGLHEKRL